MVESKSENGKTPETENEKTPQNGKTPETVVKSKGKKRCHICSKKLDLADQLVGACDCGGVFCRKHSRPYAHSCQEKDMGSEFRKKLKTTMVQVKARKVAEI